MFSRSLQRARRQVRWFILIWTAITLFMGLATFLAIYFTYRPASADDSRLSLLAPAPQSTPTQQQVVAEQTDDTAPDADAADTDSAQQVTPQVAVAAPTETLPAPTATIAQPTAAPTQNMMQQPTQAAAADAAMQQDAAAPQPTATIPPVQDTAFDVGIQVQHSLDFNQDNQDGYFNAVRNNLGLDWVKMQVSWKDVEPVQGQRDFAKLDLALASQQTFNMNMMLSIVAAPDWAREAGANLDREGPPANNQHFVDFLRALVQRYPGQIHAIEIWNEQNLDREWMSTRGLSAENYVALLQAAHGAIKAIDPNIIVISGALAPTGFDDETAVNDFRYMQQMIDAGLLQYTDCVGAHHNGYNISPLVAWDAVPDDPSALYRGPFQNPHHSWSFSSTLEGYTTRIRAARSDKRLCVTEFGWAVSEDLGSYPPGFEYAADNTLAEQAQYFREALTLMQDSDMVWLAFIWNYNYGPQAGFDTSNDNVLYSLVSPDGSFRPAWDTIREWVQINEADAINTDATGAGAADATNDS
jgi:polysaccharide biosynthesis protein PslG